MASIFLRSLIYNVLFYAAAGVLDPGRAADLPDAATGVHGGSPRPGRAAASGCSAWSATPRCEYRGVEKIPQGPLLVASKHQSMWETFALLPFFDYPLFIYKRELGLDSVLRLVPDEVEDDRGRSQRRHALVDGDGAARPEGSPQRPPADHLSGGHPHRGRRAAGLQDRRRRRSTSTAACRAFRWRSIPGCSGRAAPSCAIPARWWSSFSIRCRRGCPARISSSASASSIEAATNRIVEAARRSRRNCSDGCRIARQTETP